MTPGNLAIDLQCEDFMTQEILLFPKVLDEGLVLFPCSVFLMWIAQGFRAGLISILFPDWRSGEATTTWEQGKPMNALGGMPQEAPLPSSHTAN